MAANCRKHFANSGISSAVVSPAGFEGQPVKSWIDRLRDRYAGLLRFLAAAAHVSHLRLEPKRCRSASPSPDAVHFLPWDRHDL